MARFCTSCGGELPEGAAACPKCGAGTAPTVMPPASAQGGLADNVAGLLAYFFIPAIIFLLIEPFNKNRFVRFHSFQCLITWVALFVVNIVVGMIPLLNIFLIPVLVLAEFVLWILLLVKAYQNQMWKLPVIGDIAEKQANG